jgi:glutamate-1-semialdehyde 2,1-aminomutase
VITFRVNYGGAAESYPVKTDLTALGKIIGGGFPVGAVAGRADVMEVFDPYSKKLLLPHSGTFSANPVTMTAGYVAMKHYDKDAVLKINALTEKAKGQIREAIKIADVAVSITGAGSMFRMHLKEKPPKNYREAYQPDEEKKVINELLDFMYFKENTLMINTFACMFSTVMGQKEIDKLSEGILRAFKALKLKIDKLND